MSSTLYRQYEEDIEAEHFDIEFAQSEMLTEAKDYMQETDEEFEILTQLQHFGGKTNLIDFTTDYLIALFFACESLFDNPGRVILLGESGQEENRAKKPRNIINRVRDQKSVFARPTKGFIEIESDDVIDIPKCLKQPMLDYLKKYHDISTKTIYNDLHGFIRVQDLHQSAYTEFYKGFTCQNRGNKAKNREEKQKWYEETVKYYTEALKLNSQMIVAYNNRGVAYNDKHDYDSAIVDFSKAIELNPNHISAYSNRGLAYNGKGDLDNAIADFSKAIQLKPNDAEAYNNRGLAYNGKGDLDSAIKDYTQAIGLNSNHANAYGNRGSAYFNKGDLDSAIKNFNRMIELDPNNSGAYNNRGLAYNGKGDFGQCHQRL